MNSELVDVVNTVADKLGVAANELRPAVETMVYEARASGFGMMCFGVFTVCAAAAFVWLLPWLVQKLSSTPGDYDTDMALDAFSVVIPLCSLLMAIAGVLCAGVGCSHFLAPTLYVAEVLMGQ